MVEILPTAEAVMLAAADRFVDAAARAVDQRGRFLVALAGGSTPQGLYRILAEAPYRERVRWAALQVFWGDERCVPPNHPASNYRMARETLLDRVAIPEGHVHRMRGEAEPDVAAREYEAILRRLLDTPVGPPRPGVGLDLVLLGLGPDGHTASLFPGSAALLERERWVVATRGPAPPHWRVTLTPMIIQAAGEVDFLVTGSEKAAALQRAVDGQTTPGQAPARAVLPAHGAVHWLVDSRAAAGLSGGGSESA